MNLANSRSFSLPAHAAILFHRLLRPAALGLLLALTTLSGAAATIAGWNVSAMPGGANNFGPSPLAATAADANVTVGGLTRGSGVSVSGTGAARGWGGTDWQSASEAAAVTAGKYVTFTVTPNSGFNVSFSSVSQLNYRRSASGAASGVLQYQVGGGAFVDAATLNYSSTSSTGGSLAPIDLSSIAALQGVAAGTTVTFRIVNFGGTTSSGTWYVFDTANSAASDLEIQGTVSAGAPPPTEARVETAADGSGVVVPAQTVSVNAGVTVYAVSRDAGHNFVANTAGTWSLTSVTGGIVAGDLVPAADGKSATFTPHAGGSAVIHAAVSGLTSVDSGVITASSTPTNPAATGTADATSVVPGQNVLLTVTVTPGTNPASTGLAVTADLSPLGDSATQSLTAGAGNTFTCTATVATGTTGGAKTINFSVTDAQSRTATAAVGLSVRGNLTIFHTNDTHARVTPHKWIVPQHTGSTMPMFEDVGGAAYLGGKMLSLVGATPDALVLDGGDISEGNPIGDWNGPGFPTGTYGNGTAVEFYKMLDTKLRAVPGRGGRGLDAMVVGNHDIRDVSYINNMKNQTNFPVISINICAKGTHTAYFQPYVIVNLNGNRIGIVGYTTESADSPESSVNSLIDVVKCDWSSTDSTKIHFADIVNDLRNNQGCNLVILLTHMGHSGLCTPTGANPTPILVDNAVAKLPEIAVTGHWHTWAESVWQPVSLNYKTIFTEAGSFEHYIGELRVNGRGQYMSNANYPLPVSQIAPDPDIAAFIQTRKDQYAATNPTYGVDQVVGYTADDLLLDNYMKWWSADEYPWSGNNTAGNWICDAMQWKATQLFGHCDLSIEDGGGVRSDIPAGPVKYTQIYETFPWPDDVIYVVKMTGQEIWNYFQQQGCDAAMSSAWHVTAYDGIPTAITYNGAPIDLNHQYDVAINNYMYLHDSVPFTDPNPQFVAPGFPNGYLARTALVDYTATFTQASPYHAGPERYTLNTEFSGGYRAVVTMMNDADSKTAFDDAFIRLLSATPETLQHLGTRQVPADLVNPDGSVNAANRLAENEMYRSYLGFKTGALLPGDIIEVWGKGSFFGGDPEFVDQEGITADGVEFRVVGHDDSLAKPAFMSSIGAFWDDWHKNHYVKFLARKAGPSSVTDQTGQTISVMDVTAFSAKTLPGNAGDLLLLTGIPTMESFALRFRCDSAVLASTAGIANFPAASTVSSVMDPLPAGTTAGSVVLSATATVNNNNSWTLVPLADAQVASGSATSNFGTTNNLFVQSSTLAASSFGNERSWLRFDLSTLPAGATITSASLQLFCWRTTGTSLPAEMHGVADDTWTETGLTWNNQPALGAVLDTQTLAAGATNVWYNWNATSFAQTKWAGNKLVSLAVKPVTEDSAAAQTYGFDAKEFGSNSPVLKITTQQSGPAVTVAQVQYFYRYSADNSTWGGWTAGPVATASPYGASFGFPNGYGYYEFYSVATDSLGAAESSEPIAQASTHYASAPAYTTAAIVSLSGLNTTYDGTGKSATVTTTPPGIALTVTYDGGAALPVHAGTHSVAVTVTQPGYTGSAADSLVINPASQSIAFGALAPAAAGSAGISLTGSASSGLTVAYTSDNPAVATVTGSVLTAVAPGTANITATQTGNGDYLAATPVVQPFQVNPGAPASDDNGVPSLPEWGLITLAALLAGLAARTLLRTSHRAET